MKRLAACLLFLLSAIGASAQYTRQDTLRGSNGRGRLWWDVLKYDLQIGIDTAGKTFAGTNTITFRVIAEPGDSMQVDLQEGMELREPRSMFDGPYTPEYQQVRDGNVYWLIKPAKAYTVGKQYTITLAFEGQPRVAVNPPWAGGVIWTRDSLGKPWIAVACQGLGASSWWPCKDYQGDEPDSGMSVKLPMDVAGYPIGNGRSYDAELENLIDPITGKESSAYLYDNLLTWKVRNPINTYGASFYIGDYAHWQDTFHGEKGILDLDFYPLKYNLAKAKKQWAVTKNMLRCFEYWLGPYPFYEDGYKLVEAPYLGMEHQSAIAYGNEYKMGYRGRDLSRTGVGLSFDFIVIHESGHEWFGNSITAKDVADNWLHEGFTTYTETLFAEWIKGKEAAFRYARGQWQNSQHRKPLIGNYGVHDETSSDIYYKGAAVVHMIRIMMRDDNRFRALLRKLNAAFYHKIVTSRQVEDSIIAFTGLDLTLFFEQYLRRTELPIVYANQRGNKATLSMRAYDERFKLPVYDQAGRFICELSRTPVTIPAKDLPALLNYNIVYETGIPGSKGLDPE